MAAKLKKYNKLKPALNFIELYLDNYNRYILILNSSITLNNKGIHLQTKYHKVSTKKKFDNGIITFTEGNKEKRLNENNIHIPEMYSNGYVVFENYKKASEYTEVLFKKSLNLKLTSNEIVKHKSAKKNNSLSKANRNSIKLNEILSSSIKQLIQINTFEISQHTSRIKKSSLKKIQHINDTLVPSQPPEDLIKLALKKFIEKDDEYFNSKRKSKALAYAFINKNDFFALHTKKNFLRFSSIIEKYPSKGIAYCLMYQNLLYWKQNFTKNELLKLFKNYFKSNNYKINSHLFSPAKYIIEEKGIENLVSGFNKNNQTLEQYFLKIGLRQNLINTDFFELVIKRIVIDLLFQLNKKNDLTKKIISICKLRSKDYFSKSVQVLFISRLIIKIKKEGLPNSETREFALENIGDVNHTNWRLSNDLSDNEIGVISNAKQIIDNWMTELFLDHFWSLIEDKMRRKFWKKYASKMSNVKIILDDILFNKLDDNIKCKPYLNRIYEGTQGAVLIFEINERLFVEFGGYAAGPLQVYREKKSISQIERSLKNSVRSKKYNTRYSNNYLKQFTTFQNLMDGNNIVRDNGRFAHMGDWYYRLTKWMNKYA